jgi:hypothetical protein
MLNQVVDLFRPAPLVWKTAIVLSALTPVVLLRWRHHPLWTIATALTVTIAGSVLLLNQTRFVYVTPLAVVCCLGLWWLEIHSLFTRGPRRGALRACGALLILLAAATATRELAFFPSQRDFYGALVPHGTTAALDWLRRETPPQSLVAVAPENGLPFGWWVEGYGRRATLVGSSPEWLNFPDERARAMTVTRLLSSPTVLGDSLLSGARRAGVAYLYFPSGWEGFTPTDVAAFSIAHPGLIVFDNPAALIIRVPS